MNSRSKHILQFSVFAASLLHSIAIASGIGAMAGTQPTTITGSAKEKQTWDFESDEPGKVAKGFSNEVGRWVVVQDGKNRVLAQEAKSADDAFNVTLIEGTSQKDLDLSVKVKAVAGKNDQGGGMVWRAKDAKNYYIARYNPLEDNFRVYKVVAGKRTMFENVKVVGDNEWHTLRITMVGPKITCYFDGKKSLEAEDATFPEAGRIGLWSKADAQSYFDDLTLNP
jgi:Domain of Unknown Function (DUF1080)